MKVWHFSEMAYPQAWDKAYDMGTFRVEVPNQYYNPKVGADVYHRHYDEFQFCDELGINIMLNEHHSTLTCLNPSVVVSMSILARITKNVRLLSLGSPIANRPDPVRVAEEMAMIDVISRGRLEMGLVKGAPYEIAPANSNPGRLMERFWEAHDLILKALSTHDGPFNWEGEHYHYRKVNIWPRPWQEPHPPVWITGLSPGPGRAVAERGHVVAALLSGGIASGLFDAYRERAAELGWVAPPDRFAYCVCTGGGGAQRTRGRAPGGRGGRLYSHRFHCLGTVPQPTGIQCRCRQRSEASPGTLIRHPCSAPARRADRRYHQGLRARLHRFRYCLRGHAGSGLRANCAVQ